MQEIENKNSDMHIFINGIPNLSNMPQAELHALLNALLSQLNEYIQNLLDG